MVFIEDLDGLVKHINSGKSVDVFHAEVAHPEDIHIKDITSKFIADRLLPKGFTSFITSKKLQDIDLDRLTHLPNIITTKTNSEPQYYLDKFRQLNKESPLNYLTRSAGFDKLSKFNGLPNTYFASLPRYCVDAVAQSAITLALDCLKNTNQHISYALRGLTENIPAFRGIKNNSLSVFGAGNIGHEIIRMAKGLGFKEVYAVDLREKYLSNVYSDDKIEFISPSQAIKESDIIINAMNLTTDKDNPFYNVKYFDELLPKSKKNPIFINVARGEVVSNSILLELYLKEKIYGIGLDVYPNEAIFKEKLQEYDKIRRISSKPAHIIFKDEEHIAGYYLMNISANKEGNIYTHLHKAYNDISSNHNKAYETMILVSQAFSKGKFDTTIKNYDASDVSLLLK